MADIINGEISNSGIITPTINSDALAGTVTTGGTSGQADSTEIQLWLAQKVDKTTYNQAIAAIITGLDYKVDKVAGMGLSQENFTTEYKEQLDNMVVPIQSDWNETDSTSLSYIKNKPTILTQDDITTAITSSLTDYVTQEYLTSQLENYATTEYVSLNYLPLTGGTLNGGLTLNELTTTCIKNNSEESSEIDFSIGEKDVMWIEEDRVCFYDGVLLETSMAGLEVYGKMEATNIIPYYIANSSASFLYHYEYVLNSANWQPDKKYILQSTSEVPWATPSHTDSGFRVIVGLCLNSISTIEIEAAKKAQLFAIGGTDSITIQALGEVPTTDLKISLDFLDEIHQSSAPSDYTFTTYNCISCFPTGGSSSDCLPLTGGTLTGNLIITSKEGESITLSSWGITGNNNSQLTGFSSINSAVIKENGIQLEEKYALKTEIPDAVDLSNYATKTYVDTKIGNIATILSSVVEGV